MVRATFQPWTSWIEDKMKKWITGFANLPSWKFPLGFILAALSIGLMGATSTALYLHHEMPSLAALEADLQNREIGLDPADRSAVGKFSDGSKFHLVSQEMPSVSLTGTLGVTGGVTLLNNLTLSLIPTGRIPYTTTGGIITTAGTLAYNGTTLVVNNGTYSGTLAINGRTTLTDSLIGVSQRLSGNISAANGAFSGTLGVTGNISGASRINLGGAVDAANYAINSLLGHITTSGVYGFYSFGVATPATPTNAEFMQMIHSGASGAFIRVDKNGLGTYRNLMIQAGGSTRITVDASSGGATFSNTVTADSIISSKFYTEGAFTGTLTNCTTSPTGTFSYVRVGKHVTLKIPSVTGTSNTNAMTITGLPAAITPSADIQLGHGKDVDCTDNGSIGLCVVLVTSTGTLKYAAPTGGSFTGFTTSGTKGVGTSAYGAAEFFTYTLQ
jgi:hypothetical protein